MSNVNAYLPPKVGDWATWRAVKVQCPICDDSTEDVPLVWWDETAQGWKAYLSCAMCGGDSFDVAVPVERLKEWGRLAGGWEEILPDPLPDEGLAVFK